MKQDKKTSVNHMQSACLIKDEARRLGFSACGIAPAHDLPAELQTDYEQWIAKGKHGNMLYLERNKALRYSPQLLLPGTKSIVMVALNYYPSIKQDANAPQIAYYAYGKDYHKVVKRRLDKLLLYIREHIDPLVEGRAFCDSAPIAEKYWAWRAGLGWIGKNSLLIQPNAGSFFFLGTLFLSLSLPYDEPIEERCGSCTACINACPGNAISVKGIDARRCLSYLTIETQEELSEELKQALGNRIYGCDSCQLSCPWNRFAKAHTVEEFTPSENLLRLSYESLQADPEAELSKLLPGSAMKRAGLAGLLRNLKMKQASQDKTSDQELLGD